MRDGGLEPLGEVAQEEDRALQDPDQEQGSAVLVPVDLRRQAIHAFLQRRGVDESSP